MKMPKVLFFIAGMVPTVKENEAALEIGVVAMRNVSAISSTDRAEACDAVAGEYIPPQYADKPVVAKLNDAIAILREKQKAENATAAAELAATATDKTGTEVVGKEGKKAGKAASPGEGGGGAGGTGGAGASTGWKANA